MSIQLCESSFSGKNLGYEVYQEIMGEELFKQKIEEFEKVNTQRHNSNDVLLGSEKRNPSSPSKIRAYDLPITSSDALPLSYRRLVGAIRPLN